MRDYITDPVYQVVDGHPTRKAKTVKTFAASAEPAMRWRPGLPRRMTRLPAFRPSYPPSPEIGLPSRRQLTSPSSRTMA